MKRYLRQNLSSDKIEIIKISKNELNNKRVFKWIHSMEFQYRGAMYDLIPGRQAIDSSDYVIFTVVNDVMEEKLLAEFSNNNSPFSELFKSIKHFSFTAVKTHFEVLFVEYNKRTKFMDYFDLLIDNQMSVKKPPPKFFPFNFYIV